MKQPITHIKAEHERPHWPDRWDPYFRRDYAMWLIDGSITRRLFDPKVWVSGEYDCWACGCLDAPNDIPLGGTASVRTVGGWYREEYLRLGREWGSWASYQRASAETTEMLKGILAEAAP